MMRVGHGFDVHAAAAGDHVVLGGVRIEHFAKIREVVVGDGHLGLPQQGLDTEVVPPRKVLVDRVRSDQRHAGERSGGGLQLRVELVVELRGERLPVCLRRRVDRDAFELADRRRGAQLPACLGPAADDG